MRTPVKWFLLVAVLVILAVSVLILGKFFDGAHMVKSPSIAIALLDGSVIHFQCFDTTDCPKDFDLGDEIKAMNRPDRPITIESAFWSNPNTAYFFLDGSGVNELAKLDFKTNQSKIMDLAPLHLDSATMLPKLRKTINGKIVVATTQGNLGIVQNDFSMKQIILSGSIYGFTEVNHSTLLAYGGGKLVNEGMGVNAFLVNIDTGEVQNKSFSVPVSGLLLNMSGDMRYIYYLRDESLGRYDLQAQKVDLVIPGSFDFVAEAVQDQYKNVWYFSRRGLEGASAARILDMLTLKPVIDPDMILKDEDTGKFIISPFDNNFLIGTNHHVLVLSEDRSIVKTFLIPQSWIGRDYVFLEYRN